MKEKTSRLMTLIPVLAIGLLTAGLEAQDTVLKTDKERESYALGTDLARNLQRRGVEMEPEALMRGFRDVITGQKLLMTDEELRDTLGTLNADARQKAILARKGKAVVADETGERGAAFMAQNKTNSGVVCLPSGLQYKILKAGEGQKPTLTDTVECNFLGTLVDGRAFTGSNPAGPPATLKLSELVSGLQEALQLMPVGSKWQVFIPPQLAYGDKGVGRSRIGPRIGPNTTLIYELELLAIKKPGSQ